MPTSVAIEHALKHYLTTYTLVQDAIRPWSYDHSSELLNDMKIAISSSAFDHVKSPILNVMENNLYLGVALPFSNHLRPIHWIVSDML